MNTTTTTLLRSDRVELAPHMDLWMMGARFGTITRVHPNGMCTVKLDRVARAQRIHHSLLTRVS